MIVDLSNILTNSSGKKRQLVDGMSFDQSSSTVSQDHDDGKYPNVSTNDTFVRTQKKNEQVFSGLFYGSVVFSE